MTPVANSLFTSFMLPSGISITIATQATAKNTQTTMSQNIEHKDGIITMMGEFRIIGKDRQGNIVLDYVDNNMIVRGAKSSMARLISNPAQDVKVVTKIGVGTDGNGPTPDDTLLTSSFVKNIDGYTYPDVGQVTFNWSLGYGEANGKELREFGLLTTDGTLFARKTRGVIYKEEDLSLQGQWTIIF